MKVKVIKKFNDRTCGFKRREVGEVIEVDDKRGALLTREKFAVEYKDSDAKKAAAEKKG